MKKLNSEIKLYPLIGEYLEAKNYDVAYEVPVGKFHPRIFDVVGLNNNKVVTVEVKLRGFNKTFDQAVTRLYYSDEVLMAFPESYVPRVESVYLPKLEKMGIGLLSINEKVTLKLEPQESAYLNLHRKQKLIDKVVEMLNPNRGRLAL